MRYVFMASVVLCLLFTCGVCISDDAKTPGCASSMGEGASQHDKVIDLGDNQTGGYESSGVSDSGVMPKYQSYDQNTGLPNMVASDAAGELQ